MAFRLLLALSAIVGCVDAQRKVLFLGVDGFRAGAAAMLNLPNIRRLEAIGTFSYWARVQGT